MIKFCILVSILIIGVYGTGELSILQHPRSLTFKGHDALRESTLKEVYSAALGFSTSEYSTWNGMMVTDPFHLAEAIVTVSVDGVASINQPKGHQFPLKTDSEAEDVYNVIKERISIRHPQENTQLVHVDLSNGLEDLQNYDVFKGIKSDKPKKNVHSFLKNDIDEDRDFLKDVHILNAVADKIANSVQKDFIPDIYWFKISSLHPLVDLHGDNSSAVKEAKTILNDAILHLNSAFNKAYSGAFLFTVITSDSSHTRKTRSILAAEDATRDLNLAENYSEDYPVIFNIIFWLSIVMLFSVLAVSLFIGNMDPGRDSIIYRMTNPRMKKDN